MPHADAVNLEQITLLQFYRSFLNSKSMVIPLCLTVGLLWQDRALPTGHFKPIKQYGKKGGLEVCNITAKN